MPSSLNAELTKARTRLANEQADKLALKNAVLRGELVSVEGVKKIWGENVSRVRRKLLDIPSRVPGLKGLSDAEAVKVIRELVEQSLEELADEFRLPS